MAALVKDVRLRRSETCGFGFSILGGAGSELPPIIYDIIEGSPAANSCQVVRAAGEGGRPRAGRCQEFPIHCLFYLLSSLAGVGGGEAVLLTPCPGKATRRQGPGPGEEEAGEGVEWANPVKWVDPVGWADPLEWAAGRKVLWSEWQPLGCAADKLSWYMIAKLAGQHSDLNCWQEEESIH